jgi:hypothetical protein
MENHGGMIATGKVIRPPNICQSIGSHLVAKQDELAMEIMSLVCEILLSYFEIRVFVFYISRTVKYFDMGPTALRLVRRIACCGFLSPLKFRHPLPGLNP